MRPGQTSGCSTRPTPKRLPQLRGCSGQRAGVSGSLPCLRCLPSSHPPSPCRVRAPLGHVTRRRQASPAWRCALRAHEQHGQLDKVHGASPPHPPAEDHGCVCWLAWHPAARNTCCPGAASGADTYCHPGPLWPSSSRCWLGGCPHGSWPLREDVHGPGVPGPTEGVPTGNDSQVPERTAAAGPA